MSKIDTKALRGEIYACVDAAYPSRDTYPDEMRRYERDMELVRD